MQIGRPRSDRPNSAPTTELWQSTSSPARSSAHRATRPGQLSPSSTFTPRGKFTYLVQRVTRHHRPGHLADDPPPPMHWHRPRDLQVRVPPAGSKKPGTRTATISHCSADGLCSCSSAAGTYFSTPTNTVLQRPRRPTRATRRRKPPTTTHIHPWLRGLGL